jgi:hypothetical protein
MAHKVAPENTQNKQDAAEPANRHREQPQADRQGGEGMAKLVRQDDGCNARQEASEVQQRVPRGGGRSEMDHDDARNRHDDRENEHHVEGRFNLPVATART